MRLRLRANGEPGRGGRAPLCDERGFLLVMVMIVMLVLSTLVASTLVNSFLERSLAKNQNYASVALQAAEGGLAVGMTWVRENQSVLPGPVGGVFAPWEIDKDDYPALARSLGSGGSFEIKIRFKQEWRDVNADGDCADPGEDSGYRDSDGSPAAPCPGDVVLYNKCLAANNCFGEFFPEALYSGAVGEEGYPVIEIDSTGYYGTDSSKASSFRQIALDIARNKIDIQVEGALTARGNVHVGGSGSVDGHNYNSAGTAASSTCSDLPAVTVDAGAAVTSDQGCTEDADIPEGNSKGTYSSTAGCNATHDPTAPGKRALGKTPWDIMGISEENFLDVFTETTTQASMPGTAINPAYIWQQGDLDVNGGNGYGILVVHNANFNPDTYDVSSPASALYNTASANYDARADSSKPQWDATYGPAEFRMNGNCTFTGVIIADKVLRVNGNATTVGAVISAGGVSVDGDITGNWSAKYSCDAINDALGGFGYGTKLAWHRLR